MLRLAENGRETEWHRGFPPRLPLPSRCHSATVLHSPNIISVVSATREQPQGTRINLPKFLEGAYKQSCTSGRWVALASTLQNAQLPAPPVQVAADPPPARKSRSATKHYTVRKGDTLYAIARRFDAIRRRYGL